LKNVKSIIDGCGLSNVWITQDVQSKTIWNKYYVISIFRNGYQIVTIAAKVQYTIYLQIWI
jgi:hypothetical protein